MWAVFSLIIPTRIILLPVRDTYRQTPTCTHLYFVNDTFAFKENPLDVSGIITKYL